MLNFFSVCVWYHFNSIELAFCVMIWNKISFRNRSVLQTRNSTGPSTNSPQQITICRLTTGYAACSKYNLSKRRSEARSCHLLLVTFEKRQRQVQLSKVLITIKPQAQPAPLPVSKLSNKKEQMNCMKKPYYMMYQILWPASNTQLACRLNTERMFWSANK